MAFIPQNSQAWILEENFHTKSNVWSSVDQAFTPEECDKIVQYGSENYGKYLRKAQVGNVARLDNEIRESEIVMVPNDDQDMHWVFHRLCTAINQVNAQCYEYDLRTIETIQYTNYDSSYNGFYGKHIDTQYGVMSRKLSLTIQLTDPSEYEGGEVLLHLGSKPDIVKKDQGSITFFPSFVLHEVTPVTKGCRKSLVAWCLGPEFK